MAFTNVAFSRPEDPAVEKARLARLEQDRAAQAADRAAPASRRAYGPDLVAYNEGLVDEALAALDPLRKK